MNMDSIILKAKTRQEVALEYGINVRTLHRWLKKSNINLPGGLIDPYHLQMIYHTYGYPGKPKAELVPENVRS